MTSELFYVRRDFQESWKRAQANVEPMFDIKIFNKAKLQFLEICFDKGFNRRNSCVNRECNTFIKRNKTKEIFAHYCQYFAWPRYLPRALPAVPIFNILISPKYEPALSDAMTVFPLSATTCSRPLFTMYISLPTSPEVLIERNRLGNSRLLVRMQIFAFSAYVVAWREENGP